LKWKPLRGCHVIYKPPGGSVPSGRLNFKQLTQHSGLIFIFQYSSSQSRGLNFDRRIQWAKPDQDLLWWFKTVIKFATSVQMTWCLFHQGGFPRFINPRIRRKPLRFPI
jgi:hypothetical protein